MTDIKKEIGWQKYEMLLEEQVTSPFLSELLKHTMNTLSTVEEKEDSEPSYEDMVEDGTEEVDPMVLPINAKLIEDALLVTNFDCWIAHTNFDITEKIKKTLDNIAGVEILKVMSRYRFFIGVGKMFKFQHVRSVIEEKLLE
tara:strand:+ start:635 stop:1060 length:426 start_codon:yes stop_codon:yes gene_type:complete